MSDELIEHYKAVDVMYAVHAVFAERGDDNYAKNKTNSYWIQTE